MSVHLFEGVSKRIGKLTEEFILAFSDSFFYPDVDVFIFNDTHIDLGDNVCFACYLDEQESIFMPSDRDTCLVDVDYSWEEIYLGFLAHELVHVEQKRLGKKIQERGVRVRSRTFLEVCGCELPNEFCKS